MKKAHIGVPKKSLYYASEKSVKDIKNQEKIKRIIKKTKRLKDQKSVFERILDNFF